MKDYFLRFLYAMVGLTILGGVIGAAVIITFSLSLPKIVSLNDYRPPIASRILARDGTVLAQIGLEDRVVTEIDEIPKGIIDAFLSAEDDKFYEHQGVDYLGVMRALLANIKAGRVVQGGSTITQQVAKSLLLTKERSISRKIKDFLLALRIEKHLSKDEILFLYLNQVYLGGGYYGVKSAFKGYFDKELEEATVAESAMVAGLLVAPGRYSPYVNPQAAIRRQNYVLGRMLATGKITQEEYEAALKEEIKFRIRRGGGFKAGHFTDWVRQRVIELVGEENFLTNGFEVKTTLDAALQEIAQSEAKEGAKEIDKRQGFKGPLRHLEEAQWQDFFKQQREQIYSEVSNFFTINQNMERVDEFVLNLDFFQLIEEHEQKFRSEVTTKKVLSGYVEEDPLLEHLKTKETYEAVVQAVDDSARLIYIKIAGVSGIIPYEMFRWAHPREITAERVFHPYVTRPSTILKPGDVIHARIMNKRTDLKSKVTNEFEKYLEKLKDKGKRIASEHYLLCMLDQIPEAEAALVAMNPTNGEILSLVGGVDFSRSQFNRALQALRQPGSSFKPILYAAALENGFTPATTIIDSPEALGGVEGLNWKPRNYDGQFKGPMTLRHALQVSRNVPTIKIAQDLGVEKIHEFSARLGLNADMPKDLSLSLGSFGVTLLDLTSAFAIFPNGGKKLNPVSVLSITDRDGKMYFLPEAQLTPTPSVQDEEATPEVTAKVNDESEIELSDAPQAKENQFLTGLAGNQVYDARLAYIMTNLLRGVVTYGTGRGVLDVSSFLGAKTGTTNNYVDAWFMGFSNNVVTGVWTGFDNNETLGFGETGARSALPIWKEFMRAALARYGENDFKVPPGVVNVVIDRETGKLAKPGTARSFTEVFVQGTEPGAAPETVSEEIIIPDSGSTIFEEDEYFNNQ